MAYYMSPQASALEISEQLKKEEEWLNTLQTNLEKSRQLKESMIGILDSFEQRLESLESTVLPLYEHTAKLQRRQQNISKTLKTINTTLEFHQISNQMDTTIRDTEPSHDLKGYLKHMEKLKEAVRFFSEGKQYAHELDNVKSSYEFGCSALEREFRDILRRNSAPMNSSTVLDAVTDTYDVIPNRLKLVDLMAYSETENLKKIAKWLTDNSPSSDFLNVYAEIRSGVMMRTLQAILDAQKAVVVQSGVSGATGSFSARGRPSPQVDRKTSTPVTKVSGLRKISAAPRSSEPTYRRGATALGADQIAESVVERDAETLLLLFGGFKALLEIESTLMRSVIDNNKKEQKLSRLLVQKPVGIVLDQGDNVVQQVKKCQTRQEHGAILCLFPVSKYLHGNAINLETMMKSVSQETFTRFREIALAIDSLCVKGLEDFIEHVKSEQDKFVPRDGTVHQVTSNAIVFLEQLMEHRHCLGLILSGGEPGKVAVPKLFARILSALGLNLRNRSATYPDPPLRALFMLNNYNHILKSLQKSGVLKVVCEQNREVETYYQDQIKEQKKQYLLCWNRLMGALADFQREKAGTAVALGGQLTEKDRDLLKTSFSIFNRELETVNQNQRNYTVPDVELANSIKKESRDIVIPKYQSFYQSYHSCGFSRNVEKYVKYTPEEVGIVIDRLFDTHS